MIVSRSFMGSLGIAGEGAGVEGAMRPAKEVDNHLRLAHAAGVIHGIGAEQAIGTFDLVRAMTWHLLKTI